MIGFYNVALTIHIPLHENKPVTPNSISFQMIEKNLLLVLEVSGVI